MPENTLLTRIKKQAVLGLLLAKKAECKLESPALLFQYTVAFSHTISHSGGLEWGQGLSIFTVSHGNCDLHLGLKTIVRNSSKL